MNLKHCNKCQNDLPNTKEYFPLNKDCKDGLEPMCRVCKRAYMRAWKHKNRDRHIREYHEKRTPYRIAKEKAQEEARFRREPLRHRANVLRSGMYERAKNAGLPFERAVFTTQFIMDWIVKTPKCPCCKKDLDYGYKKTGAPNNTSPSIDRFVPSLGYVLTNVTLICWRCNNLKRDATAEELECIVTWLRGRTTQ